MQNPNLPPGVTQEMLDGPDEYGDRHGCLDQDPEEYHDELSATEIGFRHRQVAMLGLSLGNPFIRMWANGKNK